MDQFCSFASTGRAVPGIAVRVVLTDAAKEPISGATLRLTNRTDTIKQVNTSTDTLGVAVVSL